MINKKILDYIGTPYEEVKDGVYYACVQPAYICYPEYFDKQKLINDFPKDNFTAKEFNDFFVNCLLKYTKEIDVKDIKVGDIFLIALPLNDGGRYHLGVRISLTEVAISFKETGLTLMKYNNLKNRIKRGFSLWA